MLTFDISSEGYQWLINVKACEHFNKQHTVFFKDLTIINKKGQTGHNLLLAKRVQFLKCLSSLCKGSAIHNYSALIINILYYGNGHNNNSVFNSLLAGIDVVFVVCVIMFSCCCFYCRCFVVIVVIALTTAAASTGVVNAFLWRWLELQSA